MFVRRIDFGGFMCYANIMKFLVSGMIVSSLLLFATAKPGEPYVLTGKEKSVFGIFQADMKAHRDLYADEDVNEYYKAFKELNNLDGGRKLKRGEELMFPHTAKSKEIEDAEKAKAEQAARQAKAAARARARAAAAGSGNQEDHSSLFGSDTRASPEEIERARVEAERKHARQNAAYQFQHWQLPNWLYNHGTNIVGNMDGLVAMAKTQVDEQFAKALVLHPFPEKDIHVFEFEKPGKVENCFFLAIKGRASSQPNLFLLEKGISFFGAGEVSVFFEGKLGGRFSKLGGRKYNDLASFLREIEEGRPTTSVKD